MITPLHCSTIMLAIIKRHSHQTKSDLTSLYTNIPQEEGIKTICKAYVTHYKDKPPIPTRSLERTLRLVLKENSFHFFGKNYLQTHGTAMGTKVAVAFANIFMAKVETKLLKKSAIKPICSKRYIDDIFSLWVPEENKQHTSLNKQIITTPLLNSQHGLVEVLLCFQSKR